MRTEGTKSGTKKSDLLIRRVLGCELDRKFRILLCQLLQSAVSVLSVSRVGCTTFLQRERGCPGTAGIQPSLFQKQSGLDLRCC
ncbi:hypothetical protein BDZ45DRAFT_39830 [Acephala macrosclerotiorum]|nr:hypothetical protein BDZ45DRAFT_39830 [Acephala macrosclerotiorum]